MNCRPVIYFSWLLFLSVFLVGDCFSNEKKYIIGVEDINYLPHYLTEKGEYIGFSRQLLDTFSNKYAYRFIFRPLPVKRLFSEFVSGALDFKYPSNPNWSDELKKGRQFIYSLPAAKVIEGIMVLPHNKAFGLKQFKTLGTMMGFTPTIYRDLIKNGQIRKIEFAAVDFARLLRVVTMNRVDGVYIAIDVGNYQLSEILKEPDALVFNPNLPYDVQNFCLSTNRHPEIIKAFDEFLIEERAIIEQLKMKHGIHEPNN